MDCLTTFSGLAGRALNGRLASPGGDLDGRAMHASGRARVENAAELDSHPDRGPISFKQQIEEMAGFEISQQQAASLRASQYTSFGVDQGLRRWLRVLFRWLW